MFEQLVNLLINKKWHIASAESCTGRLFASSIVDIANASKVFNEAFVTYANDAKIKYLNVDEKTIQKFGVVSEEVCLEMIKGLKKVTKSEICVATSGIAGPNNDASSKPIGMVCFGVAILDKYYTFTYYFPNNGRNYIRQSAVNYLCEKVISLICE